MAVMVITEAHILSNSIWQLSQQPAFPPIRMSQSNKSSINLMSTEKKKKRKEKLFFLSVFCLKIVTFSLQTALCNSNVSI